MANRRLPVRKIKEILRMKHVCSLSKREIAQSCNVPRSTVGDYLRRARAAGLDWSEASKLTDTELESRLFPTEHLPSSVHRTPPDCAYIHDELQTHRKVNLTLTQMSAFVGVQTYTIDKTSVESSRRTRGWKGWR